MEEFTNLVFPSLGHSVQTKNQEVILLYESNFNAFNILVLIPFSLIGFEKFFPKSQEINKSAEKEQVNDQESFETKNEDDDGNQNNHKERKKKQSHWRTRFQVGRLWSVNDKIIINVAFAAAGISSAVLYFHFHETGVHVSWKDFVEHYLCKGLVDHLEVVNKQYVRVIPVSGYENQFINFSNH
uniref:Peptidase M41 FtsH extracellular domain-containing protein n=1 Tax=Periophthalmus magnuspinnatus TaxID=409849 RepID=A0A3B3Z5Z4_9GOBI